MKGVLAALALCCWGCSAVSTPTYDLVVGNGGDAPVKVTLGGHSLDVPARSTASLPLYALKIETTRDGKAVEEANVPSTGEFSYHHVFYNVGGTGDFYLVDYAGCYRNESTGKRGSRTPIRVLANAKGKQFTPVPPGTIVTGDNTLPTDKHDSDPVVRMELIAPAELSGHSLDQVLQARFQADYKRTHN